MGEGKKFLCSNLELLEAPGTEQLWQFFSSQRTLTQQSRPVRSKLSQVQSSLLRHLSSESCVHHQSKTNSTLRFSLDLLKLCQQQFSLQGLSSILKFSLGLLRHCRAPYTLLKKNQKCYCCSWHQGLKAREGHQEFILFQARSNLQAAQDRNTFREATKYLSCARLPPRFPKLRQEWHRHCPVEFNLLKMLDPTLVGQTRALI